MYCQRCGTENPDHAKFCNNCGCPLSAAEPEKNEAPKDTSSMTWAEYAKMRHVEEDAKRIEQQRIAYLQSLPPYQRAQLIRNWEAAKQRQKAVQPAAEPTVQAAAPATEKSDWQKRMEEETQQQIEAQRAAYLQTLPTWKRVELLKNWEAAKKKGQQQNQPVPESEKEQPAGAVTECLVAEPTAKTPVPQQSPWQNTADEIIRRQQEEQEQQIEAQRAAYLQSLPTWKRVELLKSWEAAKKKEQENK